MKKALFLIMIILMVTSTGHAAPIGLPGATVGADQSKVGLELDFLIDQDLDGAGDAEETAIFAKGEIGVTKRIDLLMRLGFGRFESGGSDSDTGPAFGIGTKVTWAEIPDMNLKIGSLAQMTQIRADKNNRRQSFKSYDFAIGAFLDAIGLDSPQNNRVFINTYGGLVFSAVDIEGTFPGKEDSAYGFFAGFLTNISQGITAGVELRLVGQTAISLFTDIPF